MLTAETVLDRLKLFEIDQTTLNQWEQALGLSIPTNASGEKQYSPHHINLFKNVKKNLALGKTLTEIKDLITLPDQETARPVANVDEAALSPQSMATNPMAPAAVPRPQLIQSKVYRPAIESVLNQVPSNQVPSDIQSTSFINERSVPTPLDVVEPMKEVTAMLDRVLAEREGQQKKLIETEKLNSHLYNANNMYHRKVKELNNTIAQLRDELKQNQNFKLLDEKSRLHGQLIQLEKQLTLKQQDVEALRQQLQQEKDNSEEIELVLASKIRELEQLYRSAVIEFSPRQFCGHWQEQSTLKSVVYDNFGINLEPSRQRVFRISEPPENCYGNTAVISTQYEYENNKLWKRFETLILTMITPEQIQGQLVVEYVIDDVPVCKAMYAVTCVPAKL